MPQPAYRVEGRTIDELSRDLASGRITAVALTEAYLARIRQIDAAGPSLHAVLAIEPDALAEARASDARRASGEPPRPLEGIPILIKDNIETAGPLPTTAGSLALLANVSGIDAPLVRRLRDAGAVILGKTNLSEWANYRSSRSISGWSGVGGLTRNPYALDRTACGSSSGSAAAIAASLAAAAIGTETDGSITCPAAMTGLVGLKPTVGLVSRDRVVPISSSQDTPGPMTRSVADARRIASVIAGTDPAEPATAQADAHRPPPASTDANPAAQTAANPAAQTAAETALAGTRLGVVHLAGLDDSPARALFEAALAALRASGATLVDVTDPPDLDRIGALEAIVLRTEFKAGLDAYLATTPHAVASRSLAGVIAFNQTDAARELGLFGQDLMIAAEAGPGLDDPAYRDAARTARKLAGEDGIGRMLQAHRLDALLGITTGPAWLVDPVAGDGQHPEPELGSLAAVSGWPHLTVPMGLLHGLPVGLSLIGPAWSESRLLDIAAAFERSRGPIPLPTFPPTAPDGAAERGLLDPVGGTR